jgi:hypothetical protein
MEDLCTLSGLGLGMACSLVWGFPMAGGLVALPMHQSRVSGTVGSSPPFQQRETETEKLFPRAAGQRAAKRSDPEPRINFLPRRAIPIRSPETTPITPAGL